MNYFFSKKIVFRNLQYRIFAILILAVSVLGIKYWQNYKKQITGRFLVYLQPESEPITGDRNLSNYDFGGRIVSCFNNFEISSQLCESSKTQARNFILDHWKVKKRAYVILEFNAVDNFSESYVFIEPDNRGEWQIIWKRDFSDFDRGFAKNISNSVATDVIQKTADADHYPFKRGYKVLTFIDDEGNEIAWF